MGSYINVDELVQSIGYRDNLHYLERNYVGKTVGFRPLAKHLGVSDETLKRRARDLGIRIKPRGGPNHLGRKSKRLEQILAVKHIERYNLDQIVEKTGMPFYTAYDLLRKHNIPYKKRRRGERCA